MNPTTIGDKIRNRRIELNLLQKDVAVIIGAILEVETLASSKASKSASNSSYTLGVDSSSLISRFTKPTTPSPHPPLPAPPPHIPF